MWQEKEFQRLGCPRYCCISVRNRNTIGFRCDTNLIPASMTSTLILGFSDRRLASTLPAVPPTESVSTMLWTMFETYAPPIMMKSYPQGLSWETDVSRAALTPHVTTKRSVRAFGRICMTPVVEPMTGKAPTERGRNGRVRDALSTEVVEGVASQEPQTAF